MCGLVSIVTAKTLPISETLAHPLDHEASTIAESGMEAASLRAGLSGRLRRTLILDVLLLRLLWSRILPRSITISRLLRDCALGLGFWLLPCLGSDADGLFGIGVEDGIATQR